jgi:hypothetical protein
VNGLVDDGAERDVVGIERVYGIFSVCPFDVE